MKLSYNEICKYRNQCPYNNTTLNFCMGAQIDRNKVFDCHLVSDDGIIKEGGFRSSLDQTGGMKILMEDKLV
jgi:hypothetical protein